MLKSLIYYVLLSLNIMYYVLCLIINFFTKASYILVMMYITKKMRILTQFLHIFHPIVCHNKSQSLPGTQTSLGGLRLVSPPPLLPPHCPFQTNNNLHF